MRYIPLLLRENEEVLYATGISLWANAGKIAASLALALGGGMVFAEYGDAGLKPALGLIAAGGIVAVWVKVLQSSVELAVTDRRVLAKRGIVRRDAFELNLSKIEGAQIQQSVYGRLFGYGTVIIRGVGDPMPPLENIDAPVALRNALMEAADQWNTRQPIVN